MQGDHQSMIELYLSVLYMLLIKMLVTAELCQSEHQINEPICGSRSAGSVYNSAVTRKTHSHDGVDLKNNILIWNARDLTERQFF